MRPNPKSALRALAVCTITTASGIALAQDNDPGRDFVEGLYRLHMSLTDAGQTGILKTPGLPVAFFSPEALAELNVQDTDIHLFTGVPSPVVKKVRVSADSNPEPDLSDHMAMVETEAGPQVILFSLVKIGEEFKLSNVSGGSQEKRWSLRSREERAPKPMIEAAPRSAQTETDVAKAPSSPVAAGGAEGEAQQAEPAFSGSFSDTFEGGEFRAPWSVENPDTDRYLVENGEVLFLVSGGHQLLEEKESVNLLTIPGAMPEETYRMSVDVRLDRQLLAERVFLGLRNETDDYLMLELFLQDTGCGPHLMFAGHNKRQLRSEEPNHNAYVERKLFDAFETGSICESDGRNRADAILAALRDTGARLTLYRQDYRYTATFELQMGEERFSYEMPVMTRFEEMSNPTIFIGKAGGNSGSSTVALTKFSYDPVH